MMLGKSKTKRSNGKSGIRKNDRKWGPQVVVIRDPLAAENDQNLGDLLKIPSAYSQPNLTNQVYRFAETVSVNDAGQVAGAEFLFATAFQVADIAAISDFSNTFDLYKIEAVKMTFRPRFNMSTVGAVATNRNGRLFTAIDYDDSVAPTSVSALRQYSSCKVTNWDEDHVRLIKPKIAIATEIAGGTLTGFASSESWLDLASTTVLHFGIKGGVESGAGGQTALQSWAIDLTYYIAFKIQR